MTSAYNLRVVYNNVADTASLSASSTSGSLAASNLQTDVKSEVWRSTSTTATITATWTAPVAVQSVVFPFGSFTSTCTMRVRCYSDSAGTTLLYDSGTNNCSPASMSGYSADWSSLPFGVNNYGFGGYSTAVAYLPSSYNVQRVVIDLVDTSNTLGYIEAGRLVIGNWWTPTYNPAHNSVKLGVVETTKNERSSAGDLRTDRGVMYKTLTLDMTLMPPADRDAIYRIARGNGMFKPIWVSLAPENTDVMEEQIFSIYGKMAKNSTINYAFMNQFAATLDLEEI